MKHADQISLGKRSTQSSTPSWCAMIGRRLPHHATQHKTDMRTSRIARETDRIVSALSPSRRRITRQSPVVTTSTPVLEHYDESLQQPEPSDDAPAHNARSTSPKRVAKRKRNDSSILATEGSIVQRVSPRKAPKLEPKADTQPKVRRQPAKHIKGPNGSVTVEAPANWEQVYSITAEMRKRVLAPVDTMGCESLAEDNRSPRDRRLQTLVALMLSSQTRDTVTAAAMKNLQDNLPGGFDLNALLQVEPDELNNLIAKVGFHNNKTKFIKAVALILRERFDSDIPYTIEGLVSLPGVGPKMAYLCMSAAWGRDEGIGVDVHVHRITNLWGWHKTSVPEQTRAELESWLPREKWHDINHLLVGFGQTICLPVGRRCGECELAKQKLCPSAVVGSPVKRRVKKEIEIKVEDVESLE